MNITQELRQARKTLYEDIKNELIGPGSEVSYPDIEHELISEPAYTRYSVGILYPRNCIYKFNEEDNKEESVDDHTAEPSDENDNIDSKAAEIADINQDDDPIKKPDDEELSDDINLAMQNKPASMGLTFFVKGEPKVLAVNVNYALYRAAKPDEIIIPCENEYFIPSLLSSYVEYDESRKVIVKKASISKTDLDNIFESSAIEDSALYDLLLKLNTVYRKPYKGVPSSHKREPYNEIINIEFNSANMCSIELQNTKAKLTVVKRALTNGIFSLTIMLVNEAEAMSRCIFQPEISFTINKEEDLRFVTYNHISNYDKKTEEEKSLELLYRKKEIYATGHGVSVNWSIDSGTGKIFSEFLPTFEVPKTDMNLRITKRAVNEKTLSMQFLSDLDDSSNEEKISNMSEFVLSYQDWIDDLQKEINEPDFEKHFVKKAQEHINFCRESYLRMKEGIRIISNNTNARQAFALANRAMYMQRIHGQIQSIDSDVNNAELQEKMANLNYANYEKDLPMDKKSKWRPFQLAFLLLSIKSIVDPTSEERDLVDLIWFPTGGGKTEAYLGLTAFTIFYRRLSDLAHSKGTAVMMRYTLRLLASQQFTRAATLICACEKIRADEEEKSSPKYDLGEERITIGLWIGSAHVDNTNADAKTHFNKMIHEEGDIKYLKDKYNKFQVLKCPWCGTKLTKEKNPNGRGLVGEWGYGFKNEQSFYLHCTQEGCEYEKSLPIQIIDEEIYKNPPTLLFGTVDKFAMLPWKSSVKTFFGNSENSKCPDLIIQDELHLISGPLGTMVGLYETAIDYLCSQQSIRPKIIASTATIRMAKEQCRALYNRDVRQFPAQGLSADDSFFAKEMDTVDNFGRLYLGVMPSGKTKVMLQSRIVALVLQKVFELASEDAVKDKYWTLAMYFNSIRELGKSSAVIDDDVKDFMRRIVNRKVFKKFNARLIGSASELTSRVQTSQLNDTLDILEHRQYSKENIANKKYPIDTLLATNMISVGVDVERLNVMMLVGQPKSTSEYIQASSRIGRKFPGMAITLYDSSKSRDRSHYEQFKPYHESFYKYVEPTGITPFSAPARERALHAVFIAAMRHSVADFNGDKDACSFNGEIDKEEIQKISKYILNRVKSINSYNPAGMNDDTEDVRAELDIIIDEWNKKAERFEDTLCYGDKYIARDCPDDVPRLLKTFSDTNRRAPAIPTLTSMRSVDATLPVSVLIWEKEYE